MEIVFSVVQKKVVTPNDFASTTELGQTLLAFVDRYNQTARPFNWTFIADDPPASRSSPRRLTTPDELPEPPT